MTRHLRFIPALAAALLMPLGALAADAPTPDAQSKAEAQVETKADAKAAKTARAQKAKAKETECEATASRIQRNKAGECWKSTQPSRNRTIHPFPHNRLRLGIVVRVATIVENLHEPDPGSIELSGRFQGVIVASLLHFVAFERRAYEYRDYELLLFPRHLRQRKYRACTGAFTARRDEHDRRKPAQERFHFSSGFRERRSRDIRVVHRPEPARRRFTNEEPFLFRHIGQ